MACFGRKRGIYKRTRRLNTLIRICQATPVPHEKLPFNSLAIFFKLSLIIFRTLFLYAATIVVLNHTHSKVAWCKPREAMVSIAIGYMKASNRSASEVFWLKQPAYLGYLDVPTY